MRSKDILIKISNETLNTDVLAKQEKERERKKLQKWLKT